MLIAFPPPNTSAVAEWHDYGPWQLLSIHKDGEGVIRSGDFVYLVIHDGKLMGISAHSAVQASML